MKKQFTFALGLLILGSAVCFTSCTKEDDECQCTANVDGVKVQQTLNPENFGVSTCKQLKNSLQNTSTSIDANMTWSCK